MSYDKVYSDMAPFIKEIIKANVRVLLYYGDTDMACNFMMGQKFSASLNLQESRWRNNESGTGHVNNSRHDEWDNNAMVPSSSHEEYAQPESNEIGKRITGRTEMDDSNSEPVTSTTHDDESATVSGTVEVLASEAKLPSDTVTMNEDRMLEQAIVYGDDEE
ncbi:unnamed protein product [Onchocerca ochengi]|uniref:Peptidase_S9 domain-containing protein n=1 Tax=Onchocerca ochengi TaxID=42157 RepID=A0A182EN89_ONCOC|nr:unnamed protein product [Onchocerca ochengi]